MFPKIAFVGAGSFGFTYKLVSDILAEEALRNCTFSFMDIDPQRLKNLKILLDVHFARTGYHGGTEYTLNLRQALAGADFVLHVTKIGLYEASERDMEICKTYGLYQTIGDTCGAAGVSRGLRTMLFLEKMLKTMEEVSHPGAVVLNYTNPQPMSVMYASRCSRIPLIGLCHSVQGTTRQMAQAVGVPYSEVSFEAAGINHLSFILKFSRGSEDLYPLFRDNAAQLYAVQSDDEDHVMEELGRARIDLMNRFGYMVTESSQHLCEYVPYYLRSERLRRELNLKPDLYQQNIRRSTERFAQTLLQAQKGKLELPQPSVEYGPQIINAMVTNRPYKIYANVINDGLIDNLPAEGCVEVAALVDASGIQPCRYGPMPVQLAMLCSQELFVHSLAVEAALRRDARYVYWALLADPVANGILTPDEIRRLTVDLLEAQQEFLSGFDAAVLR